MMFRIKAGYLYGGNILNINKCEIGFDQESVQLIGILAEEAPFELLCLEPLAGEMLEFCRRAILNGNFKAKAGSTMKIPVMHGSVKYVVIHVIGNEKSSLQENIREGSFVVLRTAAEKKCSSVLLRIPGAENRINSRSAAEGAVLGCYRFDKYLSQEEDEKQRIADDIRQTITQGSAVALRHVHLVQEGWIIKTSSGKTARLANRDKFIQEAGFTID